MEKENVELSEEAKADAARLEKDGNSLVLTAVDGRLKVMMGVRDRIRAGVRKDLQRLKALGIKNLVMLSGDNQGTVDIVSRELGLTEAHGNMLPEDKAEYVRKRRKRESLLCRRRSQRQPFIGSGRYRHRHGRRNRCTETSDVVLMNSDFTGCRTHWG